MGKLNNDTKITQCACKDNNNILISNDIHIQVSFYEETKPHLSKSYLIKIKQ